MRHAGLANRRNGCAAAASPRFRKQINAFWFEMWHSVVNRVYSHIDVIPSREELL